MAMTDQTGRTALVCLMCDNVDPMQTDAIKWTNSTLADSAKTYRGDNIQSLFYACEIRMRILILSILTTVIGLAILGENRAPY
jgi:hypothetical protein